MARGVTELLLKISGDNREAVRALQGVEGRLNTFGSNAAKALKAAGFAFATTQLVSLGKAAVNAAVDAEEAASAFATTFGPAVGDVADFVDEFANKAGFASYELEQMLAVTGNIVQGLGATEQESAELATTMATLAGDVASFSNAAGGSEAVLKALQSALTGEREALKTYGIVINEADVRTRAFANTGKTTAAELTKLEKATATVELAYERAGKAVGDLDRTADSNANTIRRLGAAWKEAQVEIGQRLLPVMEKLLPIIEEVIPAIADFAIAVLEVLTPALVAAAEILGIVTTGIKGLSNAAETGRDHIINSSRDVQKWGEQAEDAGGIAGDLGTAIKWVGVTLRVWAGDVKDSTEEIDQLAVQTARWSGLADHYADSADRAARATEGLTEETDDLAQASESYLVTLKNIVDAQRAAVDPLFAAAKAVNAYEEALEKANEDGKVTDDELLNIADHALDARAALLELHDGNVNNAIEALASTLGITRKEANDLAWRLGLLDHLAVTPEILLDDNGAATEVRNLRNLLDSINGKVSVSTHTHTTRYVNVGSPPPTGGVYHNQPGFQHGGITPGGPVLVGEAGPELVDLPAGSRVHSNKDSRRMMGGITINVYGSVTTDYDLARTVSRELAKMGRRNSY